MNEPKGRERRPRSAWWWTLPALALLAPLPGRDAAAGPIRRVHMNRLQAAAVTTPGSYWDRYFARALQVHALRVTGPNALQVLSAAPAAQLSGSAFVDYLIWRRSLAPARFDYYHPYLAPILLQAQSPQTITPSTPITPVIPGIVVPPTTIIPPVTPPSTIIPPVIPPSQVPEPSSWLVALGMVVASVAGRRWARAHAGSHAV